jgi:hypothetical protein
VLETSVTVVEVEGDVAIEEKAGSLQEKKRRSSLRKRLGTGRRDERTRVPTAHISTAGNGP